MVWGGMIWYDILYDVALNPRISGILYSVFHVVEFHFHFHVHVVENIEAMAMEMEMGIQNSVNSKVK